MPAEHNAALRVGKEGVREFQDVAGTVSSRPYQTAGIQGSGRRGHTMVLPEIPRGAALGGDGLRALATVAAD
jgi:hypothetical protein